MLNDIPEASCGITRADKMIAPGATKALASTPRLSHDGSKSQALAMVANNKLECNCGKPATCRVIVVNHPDGPHADPGYKVKRYVVLICDNCLPFIIK